MMGFSYDTLQLSKYYFCSILVMSNFSGNINVRKMMIQFFSLSRNSAEANIYLYEQKM